MKKKPFYKRWWFIALVVVVIIGAIGVGGDDDDVATDTSEPEVEEVVAEDTDVEEEIKEENVVEEEESEEVEEELSGNEIVLGEPINLGDYVMTIKGYELATDYEGKNALVVTYDWTNNSDDTVAPFLTFRLKGFQNGVETDDVFMVDGVDLGTGQNDARPGSTIENAQTVVGVDDLDTEMELALKELFSFGGDEFTTFINLSELQ